MPFSKKDSNINVGGRPKGAKDQVWKSVQFWFDQLETELNRKIHIKESTKSGMVIREYDTYAVDPNTRARVFMDAMKMLVGKMQELPKDPSEGLKNANEALKLLKEIETELGK